MERPIIAFITLSDNGHTSPVASSSLYHEPYDLLAVAIAAGTAAIIQSRIAAQQKYIAQPKQQESAIVASELLFL